MKRECRYCRFWDRSLNFGSTANCSNAKSKKHKTTPLYCHWCKNWSKERRKKQLGGYYE